MGAGRGRKPKPTALKILEGVRADRINFSEPLAPLGRPAVPDLVLRDRVASKAWDELATQLEGLKILTVADGGILEVYALAYSRLHAATLDIQENGVLSETSLGAPKANPSVAIAKEATAQIARLLAECGLTPVSRSRIKAPPSEKQVDELEAWAASRKAKRG